MVVKKGMDTQNMYNYTIRPFLNKETSLLSELMIELIKIEFFNTLSIDIVVKIRYGYFFTSGVLFL